MIRVALVGAAGRMGQEIAGQLAEQADMKLVAGVEAAGHPALGQQCGTGSVFSSLKDVIDSCDVVVDFSAAEPAVDDARLSARKGKAFITGVTGLDDGQLQVLREAGRKVAVVWAPNFSAGVGLLVRLAAQAARQLGKAYDIEVVETHHRDKADAPSGTALQLVEALKAASGASEVSCGRQGRTGRKPVGQIGVSSIRTGRVVGEHTVIFGGPGERLELTHKAESRAAFATGVVAAVRFVDSARPGFYALADVLGKP
jgi:4-hydroxy-tetrahydrodipicolinate reductase